jgi:transcription-repair coupling factor (superfamily II helicase)
LEALENFSDLGSGINIAMQDLDIRGAGNLLGSEQSGFIADLGYETYQKILNQAMSELKNEDPEFLASANSAEKKAKGTGSANDASNIAWVDDCALDSDIEMYFPDQYVPSDSERMLLYRELDNLANSTQLELQLDAYRKRLIDRFGPIPAVSEELILVVPLRVAGKQLGIEKIMLKQQKMYFYFVSHDDSPYFQSEAFGRILQYVSMYPRQCSFREGKGKHSVVISDVPTVASALAVCSKILSL